MSSKPVYMPETRHPAYAGYRLNWGYLRANGIQMVRIMLPTRIFSAQGYSPKEVAKPTSEIAFGDFRLSRRLMVGPAPYVGDPRVVEAWYEWVAYVDRLERHIAGPAELKWRETPIELIQK